MTKIFLYKKFEVSCLKINKVSIKNFRCFDEMSVELNPYVNIIIGNNGAGKSSLLDAISIGIGSILLGIDGISSPSIKKDDVRFVSYEVGSIIDRQPQFPVEIYCEGNLIGQELQWARQLNTENGRTTTSDAVKIKNIASDLQKQIRNGNNDIALPLISYYGTGRLWAQKREKQDENRFQIMNRFNGYTDCLSAMSNQKLMLKWFEKMTLIELQEKKSLPELTAVKKAIEECYQESGTDAQNVNVYFDVRSHQLELQYYSKDGECHKHPFHELSDGYQNTLGLVADIAYRMAQLNPQFLDNVLKETSGVVLIDEVDLHLHPKWQKYILNTLHKIFPCVQFIVTTHSPSIISSANKEHLIILDHNQCYPYGNEVYGKDVNSILFEVMETTSRPDEIENMLHEFDECIDDENIDKAKEILNSLRQKLGDNNKDVITKEITLDFMED